jgi:hypothetical protein
MEQGRWFTETRPFYNLFSQTSSPHALHNDGQVCVAILLDNFITASSDVQQVPSQLIHTLSCARPNLSDPAVMAARIIGHT